MYRFKRPIRAVFLTVFSIILLFSLGLAYLIVTPLGGKLLVRYFKQQFVSVGLMHIGHYEGNLQNGFTLKDIRIKGLRYIPDAFVRIQEIRVRLPLWDLPHADFGIFNARIFIPNSDPIVFTGEVYAGQIKGNLYAGSVDLHAVSGFLPQWKVYNGLNRQGISAFLLNGPRNGSRVFWAGEDIRKNLQGFISNVDVAVQGPLFSPRVNGSFLADNIRYKSILLTDGFSRLDLTLIPGIGQIQVKGEMILDAGLVNVRKVDLELSQSKFIFQGDVFNPMIDIRLGAKVQDMDINLAIKGALANLQLTVSSDPPMAPQEALRVLFTGNAWSSSTSPFNGVTSSELAENFLNYSLQNANDQQDIGVKTKLTDNLKLGVEMDQTPLPPGEMNTYYSRKINGEMDLDDHMSLNVSQQVFPQDSYPSYQEAQSAAETQVYLQYKKRF